MVFKKLLGALGVGGPGVDTVLTTPVVQPGGTLHGTVELTGGTVEADIRGITLTLVARVEIEHEEGESTGLYPFAKFSVTAPLVLAPGENRSIPFAVQVPWETPVTTVAGQRLHGMQLGVRTEVDIAGALDKGDSDPLEVEPLPVQRRILDTLLQLGFGFRSADLEAGHIRGTGQTLPFYQEIEFSPAPQYAHSCNSLEVSFVTTPHKVEVVLEADKRGGLFGHGGGDVIRTHVVEHGQAGEDLTGLVDGWIRAAL